MDIKGSDCIFMKTATTYKGERSGKDDFPTGSDCVQGKNGRAKATRRWRSFSMPANQADIPKKAKVGEGTSR